MFPFSALDKLFHWNDALKQANSSFLPGGPVLLVLAKIVEVAAPIGIVAGWQAPLAAWVLAAFCVGTAVLYHPFWKGNDFGTQARASLAITSGISRKTSASPAA